MSATMPTKQQRLDFINAVTRKLGDSHRFERAASEYLDNGDGSFTPLYMHAADCPACAVAVLVESFIDSIPSSVSACGTCGHDESVHGKRRKRRCDMWDFGTVRCECSGFVAVGGETAAPSERGENVLPGSNPGGGKPDTRNGALLEPRSLDAAVERLTAWANDRNPGEIGADVKVLLAAVGAESGASTEQVCIHGLPFRTGCVKCSGLARVPSCATTAVPSPDSGSEGGVR